MRLVLLAAALVVACGAEEAADDAAMDSTPPAPAAVTAADVSGTWNYEVRTMDSDSVITTGQSVIGGDPLTVTQAATSGEPATGSVTLVGDQITTQVGPYGSALRPGVMVTTTGDYRLEGGRLVGTATARYAGVTTADSVLVLRVVMTRVP
jgi:hypothetical protein